MWVPASDRKFGNGRENLDPNDVSQRDSLWGIYKEMEKYVRGSQTSHIFFKPRCKLKQNTIAQSVPAVKCESELFEFLSSS